MERLVEELQEQIQKMKTITGESCNLDEEFLNNLYSVYPFNKFEYIISHLIAKNIITLEQYLDIRIRILSEINISMFLRLPHREHLVKHGHSDT